MTKKLKVVLQISTPPGAFGAAYPVQSIIWQEMMSSFRILHQINTSSKEKIKLEWGWDACKIAPPVYYINFFQSDPSKFCQFSDPS